MRHEQSMFKKVVTVVLACVVELMLQGGDDHAADASRLDATRTKYVQKSSDSSAGVCGGAYVTRWR